MPYSLTTMKIMTVLLIWVAVPAPLWTWIVLHLLGY